MTLRAIAPAALLCAALSATHAQAEPDVQLKGPTGYHFDEQTRQRHMITARITLVFDENQPVARRETFSVPMRKIGDLMRVRSYLRG